MRRLLTIVGLIALGASEASAEGVGKFPATQTYVAANLVGAEMGRCVLGRDRRRAIGIVETQPGTAAFTKLANAIDPAMVACLKANRSATIGIFDFRSSVAEALLLENDGALLVRARSVRVSAPVRVPPAASEGATTGAVFACAVRADPTAAADLIGAPAQTPTEIAAFRRLLPSVQQCVPATGALKIKPSSVRPNTALALYEAQRDGSAR